MTRTPVVTRGPPKDQRTPVVLRQGAPPKDRRAITDLVFGIVGGLLLVLAVALFGILPEDDTPPRQWNVAYTDNLVEQADLQTHDFAPEQTHRFLFPLAQENIHSIQFTVEFTDDVAASLPDTFAFQIIAPNGEPLMEELRYTTPDSESDGNPVLPTFTAGTASEAITAQVAPSPSSGPQAPSSDDEDLANAQARITDETKTMPAGDWILEVRLVSVGDCPDPSLDPPRALACQTATNQQGDVGNSVQVVKLSFTTYDAMVSAQ